jgi:hypothetical protein
MIPARDDAGNIRELPSKTSGLTDNYKHASGGTMKTYLYVNFIQPPNSFVYTNCRVAFPLPRQMAEESNARRKSKFRPVPPLLREAEERNNRGSRQVLYSNPYSRRITNDARLVETRDARAGQSRALSSSSSTQPVSKRQKLHHPQEGNQSMYFCDKWQRPTQVIPSTSISSRPHPAIADAIIIDAEDDKPATKDDPRETVVQGTSCPDQMDIINSEVSHAFDQNKPSPVQQFSSEEKRKSPQDGTSTQSLPKVMKETESRVLGPASRKNPMKPGQVGYELRPGVFAWRRVQRLDSDTTRPSGFASGSKPSKGKMTGNGVSVYLPLKEWSIGMAVSPRDVTPEPLVNLVLEYGSLKVRDASGSTQFELQVKKGSVSDVKYVDVKVSAYLSDKVNL